MKHLIIIFILFYFIVCKSQGGFRSRVYAPGGLNHDTKDIFETSLGNYFAGGISIESSNGNYIGKLTLCGLNASGQNQWIKSYGAKNLSYFTNPFTNRSFIKKGLNIYYSGTMRDSNEKVIGTLIKFDLNGNKIWQQFYRDSAEDLILQMVNQSVDGGFLLTGFFQDLTNNTQPCLLIKTDGLGNELWRKKINKAVPNVSDGRAILQDSASKKIAIVGYQYIGNANSWDAYQHLLIMDSLGNTISQNHYTKGAFGDIIQTRDKKFVVVGSLEYPAFTNYYSSAALKFDINTPNNPIWSLPNYGPLVYSNQFSTVAELANGDLLIAGGIDSLETDSRINVIPRFVKVNSATGQIKWKRYYDYSPNDTLDHALKNVSINLTSDGGWVTAWTGYYLSNNPLFYVKYDSTGCDTTAAYCLNPVAIKQFNVQNLGLHIYPNPSNGILNVDVNAALEKPLSISISDALGRTVKQLSLSASTKIDLSDVKEGIYFLQVYNDGKLLAIDKIIKN